MSEVGAGAVPRPSVWALARTFNAISLASFGGGLSAWSREIVVQRRGWMSDTEFLSAMTICRLLPGANQVNVAIFVGTRMRGLAGAAAAVAGLVAVPFCIVLALCGLAFDHPTPAMHHVLAGLTPAAVALVLSMVWQTGRKTLRGPVPLLLFALTTLAAAWLRLPLWLTLAGLGVPAVLWRLRASNQSAST